MRRVLIVFIALVAGGIGFFVALLSPVSSGHPTRVSFVVLPGETLPDIAANLEGLGLVRERHAFVALVRLKGKSRELKAGPYRAGTDLWAWEILDRIVSGDVQDTSITIPEGLWIHEVAERVGPLVDGGAEAFAAAAGDTVLLRSLDIPGLTAEGYLFPETYRLLAGTPPASLVRQMVRTFHQVWRGELETLARDRDMTRGEVVTLASIVEAEAQDPRERPRIAAVYLNRLARDIPLQADPTVHYGLGERRTRTLLDDLEHPSPYNTYRHGGLPPGPICNPGKGALQAVLAPLAGCDDLYFVAQGDGTHLFARDFDGHRRNRQLVIQNRRRNRAP